MADYDKEFREAGILLLQKDLLEISEKIKELPLELTTELEPVLNGVKASLDALTGILPNIPTQLDNAIISRLKVIDDLVDELKKTINLKDEKIQQESQIKINSITTEAIEKFNLSIEDKLNQYINNGTNNSDLKTKTIIMASTVFLLGIIIGWTACNLFLPKDNKSLIQDEYNAYVKINEGAINSLPKSCIDTYNKKFNEFLKK